MSPFFSINPQPITKKEIQEHNPQIHCIYTGKKGTNPKYKPISEKKGGTALGTIFEKVHSTTSTSKPCSRWLGKVGMPTGRLKNDPATVRTRTEKDINLDTIREKLGYDLYQELGRDIFKVPKTRLSYQEIMDPFNIGNDLAAAWKNIGINNSLRIMSCFMEGYQDFKHAKVLANGGQISFIDYLKKYHRPPVSLLTDAGKEVPLKGFMGMLAVGRTLADVDIIGGLGGNAGFIWIRDSANKVIQASVIKIDPGECFKFKPESECDKNGNIYASPNWVHNTMDSKIIGGMKLQDPKDLQIAQNDDSITIYWKALTPTQKNEFLGAFLNCSRYLNADDILEYLFYREGKFFLSDKASLPQEIAKEFQEEMKQWLITQLKIYQIELLNFQQQYSEEILRSHYNDHYSQLPFLIAHDSFPTQELFTQLALIEPAQQKNEDKETFGLEKFNEYWANLLSCNASTHDSDMKTFSFKKLFSSFSKDSNHTSIRKVLLLGEAGLGKSSLCQKIVYDWAMKKLWKKKYKAIYWLCLRDCNTAVQPGGFLAKEENNEVWLSKAISRFVLNQESFADSLKEYINSHKRKILIILDSYDEASQELRKIIDNLLKDPKLKILITSRSDVVNAIYPYMDRVVEIMRFSDDQLITYTNQFFQTREKNNQSIKQNDFLSVLKSDYRFYSIAHIPLHLQMLCFLSERETTQFPTTLTELYKKMTHLVLDLHNQSSDKEESLLDCLGKFAFEKLKNGEQTIAEKELELSKIDKAKLLSSGLLKQIQRRKDRKEYEFLHFIFQEFLAARFISQQSSKEQCNFVLENRFRPQFQLTLSFLAGMIYQKNAKKSLRPIKIFFNCLLKLEISENDKNKSASSNLKFFKRWLELTCSCLIECQDKSLAKWLEKKKLTDVVGAIAGAYAGAYGVFSLTNACKVQ